MTNRLCYRSPVEAEWYPIGPIGSDLVPIGLNMKSHLISHFNTWVDRNVVFVEPYETPF